MTRLLLKPPWFQLVPAGLYCIPTAALHHLVFVSCPFSSVSIVGVFVFCLLTLN